MLKSSPSGPNSCRDKSLTQLPPILPAASRKMESGTVAPGSDPTKRDDFAPWEVSNFRLKECIRRTC